MTWAIPKARDAGVTPEGVMLCAELEHLEAQLDDIITELEKPDLPEWRRKELETIYTDISHAIRDHRDSGHAGAPCYEE